MSNFELNDDHQRLVKGRLHDPFKVLGPHPLDENTLSVVVFAPHIESLSIGEPTQPMTRIDGTDLFRWTGAQRALDQHYKLYAEKKNGYRFDYYDPYSFGPLIPQYDLHLFSEGNHWHAYRYLGAQLTNVNGIDGTLFATWAPNAGRVSVVGDFNDWDGRCHPMRSRGSSGVWELFIPDLDAGTLYKFEIINHHHGALLEKSDPYARQQELRPRTSSVVAAANHYSWGDQNWVAQRGTFDWQHAPISIYELHLGSWRRDDDGEFLNYREIADQLVSYLQPLGFTHIELLPITEHPLDASWGYQVTGYYAPTSRFGSPNDFRYFIDTLHSHGYGVILDWVPAHFPKDQWALANFDGNALYEHEDPRKGEHRDWGTKIFNFGRAEVKNFLISNVFYWIEEFHIDGIRVDAVASMLYLDYSREPGDWEPNVHGGNENLEAIEFMQHLNSVMGENYPGVLMIAEESTSWGQVSRPVYGGGLGFSMKWNMGWMNDNLKYFSREPIHRSHHHNQLTFGLLYQYSENFVLPFSHDEVVHEKRSLLSKMPGDRWQQFANLRLLYTWQFTYPGKKLLFMGAELASWEEWDHDKSLAWSYLNYPEHKGVFKLISELNRLYTRLPEMHQFEFDPQGFDWIDCSDAEQSVIVYQRRSEVGFVVVALNFTPVTRSNYTITVPQAGEYYEILNSDAAEFGGSNQVNSGALSTTSSEGSGQKPALSLTLPPLGGVVLRPISG